MADAAQPKGAASSLDGLGSSTLSHARSGASFPLLDGLLAGSVLSFFGLIHAYDLNSAGTWNKLGTLPLPEFAIS